MPSDRWESFFADLEQQFAAERDMVRGAWETERDRARVARLTIRERLAALAPRALVTVDDVAGDAHRLRIEAVGADWIAGTDEDRAGIVVVRLDAIASLRIHGEGVEQPSADERDPLLARMDVGFALRALARRRTPIEVGLARGGRMTGTPSRVGADHVDIAIHDAGHAPRAADVRGERTIPFPAIAWIRLSSLRDLGPVYGRL